MVVLLVFLEYSGIPRVPIHLVARSSLPHNLTIVVVDIIVVVCEGVLPLDEKSGLDEKSNFKDGRNLEMSWKKLKNDPLAVLTSALVVRGANAGGKVKGSLQGA